MSWIPCWMLVAMLLLPAGQERANPWKDRVADAVRRAERQRTIAAYLEALDVAWRADDWQAGLKLARAALAAYPDADKLRGHIARALWRAGRLDEAERVVDGLDPGTADRVALMTLSEVELARGRLARARAAAQRLEQLGLESAMEYYHVLAIRLSDDRLDGLARLLREAQQRINPDNGYPEIYLSEVISGLPEFFEAIGTEPINQLVGYGSADMPLLGMLRLPYCQALLNGQGPYRLIVDTGGSITLALDDSVARELKLRSYGTASVRGVSGTQESQQSLVDELRLGEITCRRVMTRTLELPRLLDAFADGIIGTGVFAGARMTMDFAHARLVVAPSSPADAAGQAAEVRVVGDAKLLVPLELEGRYAIGLLDSGADVAALSPACLKELFPDRAPTIVPAAGLGVGEGGEAGISLGPGVRLGLWGRTYENYSGIGLDVLDTVLSPILGVQTQVLIGMPVFRDMNSWTIDFPRRKMWVEWIQH